MSRVGFVTGVFTPQAQGARRKSLSYDRVSEEILISKEDKPNDNRIKLPLCLKYSLPEGTQCNNREEHSDIYFCRGKENCPL